MIQIAVLRSVQVGRPHHYGTAGAANKLERRWETSFFRAPDNQPRWLYTTHLEGNEQADKKNHGTLVQAVLSYSAAHYPLWQAELGREDLGAGGFGENFTIDGLSEETVCLGDIYALGEAQIQVTMPRYPCWKIEQRWGIEGLTGRVAETGRSGWYAQVLREGLIEPGVPILLVERPHPDWTMALLNDIIHERIQDAATTRAIAASPILPKLWQHLLLEHLQEEE